MQVTELLVRCNKILSVLLFFTVISSSNAQVYPDKFVHNTLKSGIECIINQNYDEAEKYFKLLETTRRDIPLGKIYLAATEIARSYDYELPYNESLISDYLDQSKKIAERLCKEDNKNVWNHYFLALSKGYSAYYSALEGKWLSAFSDGLSSVSSFEDCLNLDSLFYESYIAIGSYKFWKSKKTEFLNWLPFVDDEKDLGINYLKKSIKHSGYNTHLAIHSLLWIYIEQSEFEKAIKICESALQKNPDSRIFKWGLARAYENVDANKSIQLYFQVLNSYPKSLISNKINEVTLKHIIAQLYFKSGNKTEALKLCDEILSLKGYTEYESDKLKKRLERVKSLRNDINQM